MTAHVASLRIHTLVYVQKDSKGKTVKVSIIKLHITTFNFLSQVPLSSTYAGLNNEEKRHSFDTAVFQAHSYLRRWTAIEAIAEKVQAPTRFEPVPPRCLSSPTTTQALKPHAGGESRFRGFFFPVEESGSISVSGQLSTNPSPNPILTLTCYQ